MNLDKIIQSRKSVRKYKSKTPDWRKIIECIDSMRYAPMAGGIFSLKFILVSDPEKIVRLSDCAQQPFIGTAKYVVVVCSTPSRVKNTYGEKGEIYVRQQAGAAIQNFLLKINEKGLDTCWIGHFVEKMVKTTLKVPEDVQVEALFPIGIAQKKPSEKLRADIDNCLYFEEYKNKQMRDIKRIF